MEAITYEELNSPKAENLVKLKESFELIGLSGRMKEATILIENIIESQKLSCRIYTYGRIVSAGATLVGGVTGIAGVASAVGMAVHNIATYNPDYEIAKHLVDNKLTVTYKK